MALNTTADIPNITIQKDNPFSLTDKSAVVRMFLSILKQKDLYLYKHSIQTTKFALAIADEINLDNRQKDLLNNASLIHDIGKLLLPEYILLKGEDNLSEDEYKYIVKHPTYAKNILSHFNGLFSDDANIIELHHEHFDGNGYPYGLSGNDIPLLSKIISVADSFSAMIEERPYKRPLPPEKAIKELVYNKSTQFDPEIIDIAISAIDKFYSNTIYDGNSW